MLISPFNEDNGNINVNIANIGLIYSLVIMLFSINLALIIQVIPPLMLILIPILPPILASSMLILPLLPPIITPKIDFWCYYWHY